MGCHVILAISYPGPNSLFSLVIFSHPQYHVLGWMMKSQGADDGWEHECKVNGLRSASKEGTEGSRGRERTPTVVWIWQSLGWS